MCIASVFNEIIPSYMKVMYDDETGICFLIFATKQVDNDM